VRSDANADSSRTGGTRIAGVGSKGSAGVPAHFHAGSWGSHRSHQSNRGEKNAEIEVSNEALDFEREDMACGQTQHDDETYRGMSISFSPGDHHPSVRL